MLTAVPSGSINVCLTCMGVNRDLFVCGGLACVQGSRKRFFTLKGSTLEYYKDDTCKNLEPRLRETKPDNRRFNFAGVLSARHHCGRGSFFEVAASATRPSAVWGVAGTAPSR